MNRQKQNRTIWLAAALLPILLLGCLIASTGGALARYRAEWKGQYVFTVRPPDQVYLGKMVKDGEGKEVFDASAQGAWETVDGKQQLEFTIANGTAPDTFAKENQRVSLRLIGSLGILEGNEKFSVILQLPPEEDAEDTDEPKQIKATITRIQEGSPMFTTFGDGWVFDFFDEEEREAVSWLLEGGALNTVTLTLILEGVTANEASLLQLQISGVYAEK